METRWRNKKGIPPQEESACDMEVESEVKQKKEGSLEKDGHFQREIWLIDQLLKKHREETKKEEQKSSHPDKSEVF